MLKAESCDLLETAAEEFDRDDEGFRDMKDERTTTTRKQIAYRTEQSKLSEHAPDFSTVVADYDVIDSFLVSPDFASDWCTHSVNHDLNEINKEDCNLLWPADHHRDDLTEIHHELREPPSSCRWERLIPWDTLS